MKRGFPSQHVPSETFSALLVAASDLRQIKVHERLHELRHGNGGRVEVPQADRERDGHVPHLEVGENLQQRHCPFLRREQMLSEVVFFWGGIHRVNRKLYCLIIRFRK